MQAAQASTTRRSPFGGLAIVAGATAAAALPAPVDPWDAAIAGAATVTPKMASAFRFARDAGYQPQHMDFIIGLGPEYDSKADFPRVSFKRLGAAHVFTPLGFL